LRARRRASCLTNRQDNRARCVTSGALVSPGAWNSFEQSLDRHRQTATPNSLARRFRATTTRSGTSPSSTTRRSRTSPRSPPPSGFGTIPNGAIPRTRCACSCTSNQTAAVHIRGRSNDHEEFPRERIGAIRGRCAMRCATSARIARSAKRALNGGTTSKWPRMNRVCWFRSRHKPPAWRNTRADCSRASPGGHEINEGSAPPPAPASH
jgi:hypothetical protein